MAFEIDNGVLKKYQPEPGETEVVIPDGVTKIGERAFLHSWRSGPAILTKVVIPSGVTSIGEEAFAERTSLTSIVIPKSVISIGKRAFNKCLGLASAVIPKGVTRIEEETFNYCESMTSIEIPESVTKIGEAAFFACSSLKQIILPLDLEVIGNYAFQHCESLTQIDIPLGIKNIGSYAFSGCKGLSYIILPHKLTSIVEGMFAGCRSLSEIKLSDSVKEIGKDAFNNCSSLKEIQLPVSIKKIGSSAFNGAGSDVIKSGGKLLVIVPEKLKPLLKGTGLLGQGIQRNYIINQQSLKQTQKKIPNTQNTEMNDDSESIKAWVLNQSKYSLMRNKYPATILPKIKLKSNKPAPVEALQFIAYSYFKSLTDIPGQNKSNYRTAVGKASFVPEADKLAELLDRDSLCEALSVLAFEEVHNRNGKENKVPIWKRTAGQDRRYGFLEWYEKNGDSVWFVSDPNWEITVQALCRYGDEAMIDLVCKWINHFLEFWRFDQRGRKHAVLGRTALLLSDTRRAAMYLDKCGALSGYAQMRNKTEAEIRDGFASALGFNMDGTISLDVEE